MKKVLWIAPNLNHYKARFLSRLADGNLHITVLAGSQMTNQGHRAASEENGLRKVVVPAVKEDFNYRFSVYKTVLTMLFGGNFDVVLMPSEKKHFLVIIFLFLMKFLFRFELASYNHPTVKFRLRRPGFEKFLTRLFFLLYDKIIFYTEQGRDWAVEHKLIPAGKAFYANNTLDTELIWQNYSFTINRSTTKTLLFIGRLVPSKRLDLLFQYYQELKKKLPNMRLIIIGDGPGNPLVREKSCGNENILWRGAVVDEAKIAQDMKRAHLVFHPGASGLTIVHAFCYGKPYVTLRDCKLHGPELSYLVDSSNGLLLKGDLRNDVLRITDLLKDENAYNRMCHNAFAKAQELSIDNWCSKIKDALFE